MRIVCFGVEKYKIRYHCIIGVAVDDIAGGRETKSVNKPPLSLKNVQLSDTGEGKILQSRSRASS